MNSNFDYLIVGCGLYGVTLARRLTNCGFSCLLIDKRNHIGGNIYDEVHENKGSIMTYHLYGPHVFHTSNDIVINFISKYAIFNNYRANILAADDNDNLYHLPFNMNTFYEVFKVNTVKEVKDIINKEISDSGLLNKEPTNLEEQAIKSVGSTIYNKFIKNYTEKQWNTPCNKLSPDIIKRLPIRYYFDNNYFNDKFQGVPIGGYTKLIKNIIEGTYQELKIPYILNLDFITHRKELEQWSKNIIYCGSIDELFDYKLGILEYRSLEFKNEKYIFTTDNTSGTAQINFIGKNVPYTRMIEHIYFTPESIDNFYGEELMKTFEKPVDWNFYRERYYSIPNKKNIDLYNNYIKLLEKYNKDNNINIYMGGRLGKYKYLDMDDTILEAIYNSNELMGKSMTKL